MKSFEGLREGPALRTPELVKMEILRFVGLVPLAHFDFRTEVQGMVTAIDASSTGGGVTRSKGLSPCKLLPPRCHNEVTFQSPLMFAGLGHIAVEKNPEARRVTEARHPFSLMWDDVATVDAEVVKGWATHFSQASLIVIGAGPPCRGLNADRKGALKDERSCLFANRPFPGVKSVCSWNLSLQWMIQIASLCRHRWI